MARKIVITSGKGGVGKTTLVANLGVFLAKYNYKVALIDLDIGLNNLDVVLGMENKVVFDIIDVLRNRCRIRQAFVQDMNYPSLYLLPSSQKSVYLNKQEIKKIIEKIDNFFDYILIDSPAGIDEGFHRAVLCADEAIVVVNPHISSIRDADKVISILSSSGFQSIFGVINRVRGDLIVSKEMLSVEDIYDLLNIKILGVIPEDDGMIFNSGMNGVVSSRSGSYRAYELLTSNILNGSSKIFDCTIPYKGFLGMIKRKLKRKI